MITSARRFVQHASQSRFFQPHYGAWIDGAEYNPANSVIYDVEDPARRKKLCTVLDANADVVDKAVKSSRAAFESGSWSKMDVRDRAEILNEGARALRKR